VSPKKKSFKATWITAGIFIILAVVALLLDSGDKLNRDKIKIYKLEKEDIRAFELVNNLKTETVICERNGAGEWGMTKPAVYETEKSDIETVLTNLASLSMDRKIEKPGELKDYGLEKPSYSAGFTLKNGKKYTLLLGDKSPTGTFYYVKDKESRDIYLGYSYSLEALIKGAKELRKKSFFDINAAAVNRIDMKFEAREYSLLKGEDKNWLIAPYNFKGSTEEVEKLINNLKKVKAADIIEDEAKEPGKYGLDRPRLLVTVFSEAGKKTTALIGKKLASKEKEEDYAKLENSPIVYSIGSDFLKENDKNYNDYRDKKLVYLKGTEVNEIEILAGKKKFTAIKGKNGVYVLTEPAGKNKGEEALKKLLTGLLDLKAEEFIDDSGKKLEKYGLKNPAVIVSLYNRENNGRALKFKIFLGEQNKTGCFVRTSALDSVFSVSKSILETINEIEKAGEAK